MRKNYLPAITTLIAVCVPVGAPALNGREGAPSASSAVSQDTALGSAEEAKAYTILTNACQACHGLEMLVRRPIASTEWSAVIEQMKGYGLHLSDDDRIALERYLAKTYSASP